MLELYIYIPSINYNFTAEVEDGETVGVFLQNLLSTEGLAIPLSNSQSCEAYIKEIGKFLDKNKTFKELCIHNGTEIVVNLVSVNNDNMSIQETNNRTNFQSLIKNKYVQTTIGIIGILITIYVYLNPLSDNTKGKLCIKGKVVDINNKPVTNVKIIINGSNPSFSDSQDGAFSVMGVILPENNILDIYIGSEHLIRDSNAFSVRNNIVEMGVIKININQK